LYRYDAPPSLTDTDAYADTNTFSAAAAAIASAAASQGRTGVSIGQQGVAVGRLRRTGYSIRRARLDDVDALVAVVGLYSC
jgi:hypothetical protein